MFDDSAFTCLYRTGPVGAFRWFYEVARLPKSFEVTCRCQRKSAPHEGWWMQLAPRSVLGP